jgi:energy-coupling factor transporter ATP-binding protein EcfA2
MRLSKVQITEFKSIKDSGEFEVGDITCLVGKNEAGKTALLQALYRLNPIVAAENKFDVTDDYPRGVVEDYREDVEKERRKPATVVQARFALEQDDLNPIKKTFGAKAITKPELVLTRGYENETRFILQVSNDEALKFLFKNAQLAPDVSAALSTSASVDAALETLTATEQTEEVTRLSTILTKIQKRGLNGYIYDTYLEPLEPKFLYFDEYYQMKGFENIEALTARKAANKPEPSDHPMLGLIELARLDLAGLVNPTRTQELVNKLEGAGNHLGQKVLKYWSQNRHLQTRFDVRPARPQDPPGMTSGNNIWAGVYDSHHMVTTNLGTRSRGFVWFFSFLAWYSQIQKKSEPVILLLDEPGLSLHAKAQEDLLRYFEQELKEQHQLIYTTHSPFMVDSQHFERVRIVQDKGIDARDPLPPEEDGTKVITDVFEATEDSLFPLQGALGYEIYQTLFIGPNNVVVEGVSDLLYSQVISSVLERTGREGLSQKWTITPVGGSDKVPTFVALISSQKGLRIATLIDIQKKDQQSIENLYKRKLLKKNHVLTFAEFTGTSEADIEDMFDIEFFLKMINEEFKADLQKPIAVADLNNKIPRTNVRLEEYFRANPMKNKARYNHFRIARYFFENIATLETEISAQVLDRFENAFKKLNALVP